MTLAGNNPKTIYTDEEIDDETKVLRKLEGVGEKGATVVELAQALSVPDRNIKRVIASLAERGLAVKTGEKRRGYFGNALPVWRGTQLDFFRV